MATNSGDTLNTNNGSLGLDRLDSFFRQDEQAKAVKPVAQPRKPIDSTQIDAIANGEGLTPTQRQVMGALLAQESGGNANVGNSVDGAMGAGQIMPATFKMYAKAGEDIANPEHNLAVMARIVKDLGSKSGDDPAKIATGYFSGPGNINSGSTQAWKNDAADGNGKRVSSYVADVMNRIGGSQTTQQPKPLAVDGAPTWKSVTSKPEYMSMSAEEKAGMRDYYFEKYIAPDLQGDQVAQAKSWFDGEAAKLEPKEPGLIDRAMGVFDNIHTLAENREKERLQRLGVNVNAPIAPVNQEPSLLEKARQTAGNLIAGTLKIGPTAVKGAADIANMVTGDSIDLGVSKSMERGMKSIDEVIGSDKFNQQQKEFAALMADDNKGIGDLFGYLVDNPAILVDNTITTVGSMFLPAGAAKGAVGAATMLGAGKAAATKAAVIASMGTAASQNAADTFSTLEKENLQDRYKGAAVSGAVSLLMGIATGGGAEAAIAKRLAGDLQAGRIGLDAVKSFFKAAGKEGIQEAGEEVGNISGESVGSLTAPSTSSVGKRAALAGTLGAAIGGGVDVANNIGTPEQAPQPAPTAAPTANPVAEAAPVAKAEPTAADQDTIDLAESRREILMAKRDGTTVDQISEDGTKMVAVDKAGKGLSKAEQAELQAIEQAGGDVAKLNELYGITKETPANVPEPAKVEQEAQAAQGQEGKTPESLQPGTPEYDAHFEKLASEKEDARQLAEKDRVRSEGQSAFDKKNGWRKSVNDWFASAKDGETITTEIEGEEYKIVEKTINRDGKTINQKRLVRVNGHGVGKDLTIAEMRDGLPYSMPKTDIGYDTDGTPQAESTVDQTAAILGKLMGEGKAKKVSSNASEPATVEQPQAAEEEATDNNEQVAIAAADYGEFAFSTGASRDSTEGLENQFEIDNYKKGWDRAAEKAKQSKPKTEKEAIARREEKKKQQESGGLSIGKLPNSAEPITVKDGTIYVGKYPAQDFDTGEDVRVANDATPQQIKDALTKAGAIGRGNKIFGLNNTETVKNEPQTVETKQAEAQGQEQQAAAEPVKAEQAATGVPEATAGSAQPVPVAKPKTEKERNQQADYSEKWFGSQDKAQAFINKKRIGDSHEVVKNGQKFEIKAKAAAPVEAPKPKTEKEAKAKKAATPRKMTNEGRAEDGKPINGGDTFATSSGRATTPYPTQKSEKYASQWLIDNAIAEATARGDDFNANMFKGEKANNLPPASVDSMQEYLFGQQPNVVPSILKPLESNAAPADDLDAMFDDVLAEEVAKAKPVKPKTEKEAKEKSSKKKADQNAAFLSDYFTPGNIVKSYSGFDRVVSYTPAAQNSSFSVTVKAVKKDGENWVDTGEDARTHATFPSQKEPVVRVSVEVKPATEREARTTKAAAVSAAKNTAEGFGNAIDGLGKLFGGKGTFGSGPVFNEETYAKAKPLFQAAVANFDQAGADIKEVMRAVVKSVLDKFGEAVVNNMKPYIVRFVVEYQQPANLVDHLYNAITAGNMPKDNPALRKMVAEFDKKEVSQERLKQAQEDIEAAIARVARDAVAKGGTDAEIFARLQDLYQSQPNLNIRTSTSVENQAYSTPAPLAFLAARLAGIGQDTKTYEPTAGNGMLLITANPANATANELEGQRFANLKAQGFKALQGDALEADVKAKSQDSVITNPPFGSVKDANGNATKVSIDGYKIGKIDHLIAAKALDAMKNDGKAALIIGADKVTGGLSADDRTFFNWLYSNYNVVGQFEVDGKLYTRQGAGWPVRVIAINGRNKSGNVSPREGTIGRAKSWSEVYESYQNVLDASNTNVGNTQGSVDGGSQSSASNELQPVSQPAGTKASGTNSGRSGGSKGSTGNERGTGARTSGNSGKQSSESVGSPTGTDGQLAEDNQSNRLEEGKPTSGAPANAGATKPARDTGADRVDGNEFQAPYIPRSARKDEGVLIPINMRDSTQDALSRLEDEVGDIDQFAAKELGYKSVDQLHDALMGLQVDSVATAISQIKNGKGVVIADQTGIGKGRQAAAIIRWAVKNGHIPVFVTVKPQLFTDMYGDLADIGTSNVNPLILNVDESISGKNGEKLFANNKANHKRVIEGIASSGRLPANTNALFMTYSQINTDNVQRRAVMALSDKAVFILDESHNAAGQSGTGKFIIDALQAAKGVTYLSATFAKRPDNVPLYFKTDIGDAIGDDQALMSAMLAGGLPLQTVVSNNLVKSGQMFRRERSYDGVSITTNIDTANRASHEKLSDTVTAALRAIVDADRTFHKIFFDAMKEQIEKNGGTALDIAGNQASQSVAHTEFSSVVHNFVRQLLLGLKADTAAKQAIAAIKEGKRPIIAVENTMGSFLQEYAANNNIQQDGPLGSFDYRTVLSRALERSRHVVKVDEKGNKVKSYVPLKDLDPITRSAYDKAQRVIDGLNMDIPVSPIDWMRAQLAKAGYTVAEITGRDLAVDYSNPKKPILSRLSNEEQNDKVATTRKFNAGELDALILNVAGSTGISLHASEKFKDQRPRHMIIAQAAQDINIFMQMLGRIHRTGQVVLPSYEILNADLPAEKRPTALLSKKMKSLNANTSSNTESATSVKAADMMNKYGDQVVGQYLDDNPDIRKDLGFSGSQIGEKGDADEDIARKATGRLALMPVEVQKHVYADLEEQYSTLIEYLNKTNQNDLEPRTFDFDAKEVKQDIIFKGDNPNSPFGADAVYNEFSIKAQGSPMTPAEIKAAMNEHLDGKTSIEHSDAIILKMRADNKEYFAKQIEKLKAEGETEINMSEFDDAFDPKAREPIAFINSHRIGTTFRVEINGDLYNAVVTNIRNVHKGNGSPYAMSKVHVTVAVNGALRSVTVPATQFKRIEVTALGANNADRLFDAVPRNEREKAKIITGNLLSAYGELKGTTGTIINFTREDGSVEQGILLPKKFDFKTNTMGDFNLRSGEESFKFLSESNSRDVDKIGISSRDGTVRITPKGDGVTIQVPKSKAKGAKYFLEKTILDVTGDFTSSGNFMTATVPGSKAAKAIDAVMKKSALYVAPSMSDEAKTILGVVDKPATGPELLDLTQDSALAGNQSSVAQMKSLASRLADGKITPSEYKLALTQLTTRIAATTLNSTGTANIRAALLAAKESKFMRADTIDFALWMLDKNPAIAAELSMSFKDSKKGSPAGSYKSAERLITLFKQEVNSGTAVHEMLHHTERMMPSYIQREILREWQRAWNAEWDKSSPEVRRAMSTMLESAAGNDQAFKDMAKAFQNGTLNYDTHYQLANPSEYWAVNATRLMSDKYAANHSWAKKAKQFIKDLIAYVKDAFGFTEKDPIVKALNAVLNGDGTFKSDRVLAERMGGVSVRMNDLVKDQTQTEAFKKWFGDSKVVDGGGKPLVVYHGTGEHFTEFKKDKLGSFSNADSAKGGFFFTDSKNLADQFKEEAQRKKLDYNEIRDKINSLDDSKFKSLVDDSGFKTDLEVEGKEYVVDAMLDRLEQDSETTYISDRTNIARKLNEYIGKDVFEKGNVIHAYLSIQNPLEIVVEKDSPFDEDMITSAIKKARANGYDGVSINGMLDSAAADDSGNNQIRSNVYIAFAPNQIKSATGNNGNFDAGSNSILQDLPNQRETTERTQQDLIKEFGKPTFSSIDWWDKSVGTQFNKAAKNPEFKKVFDLFLARENATSLTAVRAAELAPGFLPRVDDFKSAAITVWNGKKASRQHELAAQAILEGTLYGQSVLDGKVWSVEELRAKGLDEQGIALYTQARDAIDASLNEVAAAEGYAALQMFIPRAMRAAVMDNPRDAVEMLRKAIDKRIAMDEKRLQAMKNKGATDEALAELEQDIEDAKDALNTMEQIFAHVDLLKAAGYAPLMRFGKYFVSVEEIDPNTGKTVVNESGEPNTVFFSRYETEGEAQEAYFRMKVAHGNDKTMKVIPGPVNDEKYKMYAGISPETMALFAEVVGAKEVENKFYQQAISERSALKRRLERKAIAGYSQDLPRVLANFITSNGRHSAGRYYTRDINSAIKYIPREKGDVQKEAQRLKEYLDNPQDAGAMSSGLAFTWFLGGNIASALINATQPVMMSLPYLSQWGTGKASAALTKAAPMAMGKKQITDPQLRHDLKRASQEGKVDAQEIFHLYTVGIQGVANALSGKMSKLPLVGKHVKGATESGRARMNAALTLWGMPFAVVEGFNRRLTFIAAWNMAKAQGEADPYAFATRAVDETQGIYNKVNRPNWARSALGRTVFTFTQFRVMNVELIKRMATKGGPAGKRAAAVYLAVLILAAGLGGLPYADDIDDIIDTVGQFLGYDTNMKRNKREWAQGTLGKFYGDLALYGMSSQLPLDFGGRMGLGNMIPSTGIAKPSNKDRTASELLELGGPVLGGLSKQVADSYEELAIGNGGKALAGMAPTSIKNMAAGLDMMATGKAKDMRGREKIDVTPAEGAIKAVGFNPTKVSNVNRTNMPIQQDLALQKMIESNIVDKWAQGIAQKDKAMQDEAKEMMSEWNRKNPKTPVAITANQIRSKVKTLNTPADTRLFKSAPREMRGRISAGLDDGN